MKIISFFSGCGGMDLGFKKAGFEVVWGNDNAASVWKTYEANFPNTFLCKKSIKQVNIAELPQQIVGIIGGPPCQSWSNAGSGKGLIDKRGLLFFNYINIIEKLQPHFFVAENVEGLLSKRNQGAFSLIKSHFENAGYNVKAEVINSCNFNVPQRRKRVFFVGYRYDIPLSFEFPKPNILTPTVKDFIYDLQDSAVSSQHKNKASDSTSLVPNHVFWEGSYSYIYMSRNRVLSWDEPSYTIQASGRQASIHPQAPKMVKVSKDVMAFAPGFEHLYRRLTVRECARLQSFPDDFIFHYDYLNAGYKMIGNSVPVNLSHSIASVIFKDMKTIIKGDDICHRSINSIQQQSALV